MRDGIANPHEVNLPTQPPDSSPPLSVSAPFTRLHMDAKGIVARLKLLARSQAWLHSPDCSALSPCNLCDFINHAKAAELAAFRCLASPQRLASTDAAYEERVAAGYQASLDKMTDAEIEAECKDLAVDDQPLEFTWSIRSLAYAEREKRRRDKA